jgi:Type I phosphodiesterase / nucleotide pyrophosphatase
MKTRYPLLAAFAWVLASLPATAAPGQTRNVVLIVSDGLRWQEVFTGADPLLLDDRKAGGSWTPAPALRQKYWHADPAERRKLLFPFLWGTVAARGQLFGNQLTGSRVTVANGRLFSYPGYNEMLTGRPDPRIDRNDFGPNPNVTVFEWLNGTREFHGGVEVFGTWSTLADIFNATRSHLPVRVGPTLVDRADPSARGQLFAELYRTTTHLYGSNAFDGFLHLALRDHLQAHHPRVLFVGYGDTDLWAHMGRYDLVLETAHSFDQFIGELWRELQALPQYRDSTTFILTADHGRGSGPEAWKEHGVEQPGSENIWLAVMGPDTAPLGERHDVPELTQAQVAATVAAFLGQDFRGAAPAAAAAAPIAEVLPAPAGAAAH